MIYEPEYISIDVASHQIDLDQRLYFICEYHETLSAIRETGGLAIAPSEPAYYEITGARITTPNGKTVNVDWLLQFLTIDQVNEIQQDIMESMQ